MKRIARPLTILFALAMLVAYVVYSQVQQNRTVAPSSKVIALPEATGWHFDSKAGTNSQGADIHRTASATNAPMLIAPGSKSAAVFSAQSLPAVKKSSAIPTNPIATSSRAPSATVTNGGTNRLPMRPLRSKP